MLSSSAFKFNVRRYIKNLAAFEKAKSFDLAGSTRGSRRGSEEGAEEVGPGRYCSPRLWMPMRKLPIMLAWLLHFRWGQTF